jgi:hypothetical protein
MPDAFSLEPPAWITEVPPPEGAYDAPQYSVPYAKARPPHLTVVADNSRPPATSMPISGLTFVEVDCELRKAGANAPDALCSLLDRCDLPPDQEGKLIALAAELSGCGKVDLKTRVRQHLNRRKSAESRDKIRAVGKPVIQSVAGQLDQIVVAADAALAAGDPPSVFQRGSALVRVSAMPAADLDGCKIPASSAIVVMTPPDLRIRLAEHAKFVSINKDGCEYEIDPPDDVASCLRANSGNWTVPRLQAVTDVPIINLDTGEIRDRAGYDAATGLFYTGAAPPLTVPDNPSRDDALSAATALLKLFEEFPFRGDQEAGRRSQAVVLAYILTGVVRQQIGLAPLTLVSATAPGTGKGLLIEACNLILFGRDAALMPPITEGAREEEERKRFTGLLLRGVNSVHLDNWSSAIGSDAMNMLLTSAEWSDRVLGSKDIISLPSRLLLAASGNNIAARGDMVRRTLLVELDARTESPELRTFKVANLPAYIHSNRRDLLSAAFMILRAFVKAGRPSPSGLALGRFEEWSGIVADAVEWLGWPNPVDSQDALKREDPETSELVAFLEAWHDEIGDARVSAGDLVERSKATPKPAPNSYESGSDLDERIEGWVRQDDRRRRLRDRIEEISGSTIPNKLKIAKYLGKFRDRRAGGYVIFRSEDKHTKSMMWQVVKNG